jgi:hypothetical protein
VGFGGPYRQSPRVPTGVRVVRLTRPGVRSWWAPLGLVLLLGSLAIAARLEWIRLSFDRSTRTCTVSESALLSSHTRIVRGVRGAWFTRAAGVDPKLSLLTDEGDVPLVVLPGVATSVAGNFADELGAGDNDACAHRMLSEHVCSPERIRVRCHEPPLRVFAEMAPSATELSLSAVIGSILALSGLFACALGLVALRDLPLSIDDDRRALLIPALGHGAPRREIAIDSLAKVVVRSDSDDPSQTAHVALFVVTFAGVALRVTPLGLDRPARMAPARRRLAAALGLE